MIEHEHDYDGIEVGQAEFVPRDRAVWQSETAKSYWCDDCNSRVFTSYDGEAQPWIECQPEGHMVAWWTA